MLATTNVRPWLAAEFPSMRGATCVCHERANRRWRNARVHVRQARRVSPVARRASSWWHRALRRPFLSRRAPLKTWGDSADRPRVFCFLFAIDLHSSSVAVVLFCQCGSDRVDVTQWNGSPARLRCFTCEREAWLDGFTVSDLDPVKLVTAAVIDQARKHRRRSPQELDALKRARTS
jgi:hypothetical protein